MGEILSNLRCRSLTPSRQLLTRYSSTLALKPFERAQIVRKPANGTVRDLLVQNTPKTQRLCGEFALVKFFTNVGARRGHGNERLIAKGAL